MTMIQDLQVLRNGAVVLHSTKRGDVTVVLARRGKDDFVTWCVDDDGNAFWGRYHHEDFKAACDDYFTRIEQ